jgi:hypothetical protein
MVADFVKGVQGSNPIKFTEINKRLYITALAENKSYQLWALCNPKASFEIKNTSPVYVEKVDLVAAPNSEYSYQWLRDSKDIDKATLPTFTATESGVYQLRVEDKIGCTAVSTTLTISISKVLSNAEEINQETVQIYPNPSRGEFKLILPQAMQEAQIQLFDLTGRERTLIHTGEQARAEGLVQGTYFLRVTKGEKIVTKKIVVE